MKTIGEHIRELREENGISLRGLAREIGVSSAFMSDIELDRRFPSDQNLQAISQALGAEPTALQEFDTRPPLDELRKIMRADPTYAFALRQMIDREVGVEELMEFLRGRDQGLPLGKYPDQLREPREPRTPEEERADEVETAQAEANRAIGELNNVVQRLNISGFAMETQPDPGEAMGLEVTMYLPDGTLLEEISMNYYQ